MHENTIFQRISDCFKQESYYRSLIYNRYKYLGLKSNITKNHIFDFFTEYMLIIRFYTMNIKVLFIILCGIILFGVSTNGALAQSEWNYVSPVPGSSFINPENNIVFRHGMKLDETTIDNKDISVIGSLSGEIFGEFKLSSDSRTLIFKANKPYKFGEVISVKLMSSIKTLEGNTLDEVSTSFIIKPYEINTQETDSNYEPDFRVHSQSEKEPLFTHNSLITYGSEALPENFPPIEILTFNNPSHELCFYSPEPQTDKYGYYVVIIDNYGTPVFYRQWHDKAPCFQAVANNQLVHKNTQEGIFDRASFIVLDNMYNIIDTLQVGNGYKTNTHDMLMLENGNHYLIIYDSQPVGMDTVVPGGDPNATVKGFVLQELDPDHNVIFQWRSWDHFEITDANHVDLTASVIDYVHVNAIDTTTDGNILLCSRHMDEITKIDRNTGDIIWRFGPKAENNEFSFTNDTMGFSYQHDIQQLENGNLTLFDNGNFHNPNSSRAMEYEIDEENLTATLVWEYTNDPIIYANAKGSTRRLDDGNTIIGWGNQWPIISTEVALDGTKTWELNIDSASSYRTMKFDWETSLFETNIDTIDYGYYNGYEPWPVIFTVTNNADYEISITSASNHSPAFYFDTQLPVTIAAGSSTNMMVSFFPEGMGLVDFEDVLTLNYDSYYADTLNQRIARQIILKGTTADHSSINEHANNLINIFPIPSSGFVTIVSDNQNIEELIITNSTGKRILMRNGNLNQKINIDISRFAIGIYFAEIKLQGNPYKIYKKFIKN